MVSWLLIWRREQQRLISVNKKSEDEKQFIPLCWHAGFCFQDEICYAFPQGIYFVHIIKGMQITISRDWMTKWNVNCSVVK